jgi:hypothetical protein
MIAAVEPFAVAQRIAIAQQEHRQPLVIVALLADLLAVDEDRYGDPIVRPRQDRVRQVPDAVVERRVPGVAEADRIGASAQRIGRTLRHTDDTAGVRDTRAFSQGLDESLLPFGHPAIEAGPGMRGCELGRFQTVEIVGCGRGFGSIAAGAGQGLAHLPAWITCGGL